MTRLRMATALAVALVLGIVATGAAATPAATPVHVLGGYPGGAPAIVVDSTGAIHVAASLMFDEAWEVWYATNRGGTWTHRLAMPMRGYTEYREPSIALDEEDRVHIAAWKWESSTGGCNISYGIDYVTDRGRAPGTFGTPVTIVRGDSLWPSLKVVGGVQHLAYANRTCRMGDEGWDPGPYRVFLRTNAGAGWAKTRVGLGVDPSLRIADDASAHVAYLGPAGVRYAVRPPRGVFSGESVATGNSPSLALDSADAPQIAYVRRGNVYWSERGSSGWAADLVGPGKEPSLTIDGANVPHVIAAGKTVVHYWQSGGTWLSEAVTSVRPEGVAGRASSAGLVVAWSQTAAPRGIYVVTL